MMNEILAPLRAPFPYFGGKSRVAHLVWERFGQDVPNYVEPFAGSLAVPLARPAQPRIETVNDIDCYIANFWRALQRDPAGVARWADWPVNEADLHARHRWLVDRAEWRARMRSDPDYCDSQIAGWWVWGICCWIGSGWCSVDPTAPPRKGRSCAGHSPNSDKEKRRPMMTTNGVHAAALWNGRANAASSRRGIHASSIEVKRPNLHRSWRGVTNDTAVPRNSLELGAAKLLQQKLPSVGKSRRGVLKHQIPDISGNEGAAGRGIHASARSQALIDWMQTLAVRLRKVRVCCGDWKRVLGRSPTECIGVTAVFLDPPYGGDRDPAIYGHDCMEVAKEVRTWALAHGDNPKLRIALCGYESEHDMPGWDCLTWKANGGHGNTANGRGRANASRERIWFSPHCLPPTEPGLFD